jgi:hypothetical protein
MRAKHLFIVPARPLWLLAFTLGCDTAIEPIALRCDIFLSSLAPTEASPGATVTATGTPLTTTWDTALYVGDTRAPILRIDRDQCTLCDDCRAKNRCTACSDCDLCADTCRDMCVETITFSVPPVSSGVSDVTMYNRHGQSNAIKLSILGTLDTGLLDTGPVDTGEGDTATTPIDSGDSGAVILDTATPDSGALDSGDGPVVDTASR